MIETVLLLSIPGYAIAIAGLVYMHKYDKPDEVEVEVTKEVIVYKERIIKVPLKTVTKNIVVYRDGKEPYKHSDSDLMLNFYERQGFLLAAGRRSQELGIGAAQQDPSGRTGVGLQESALGGLLGMRVL